MENQSSVAIAIHRLMESLRLAFSEEPWQNLNASITNQVVSLLMKLEHVQCLCETLSFLWVFCDSVWKGRS